MTNCPYCGDELTTRDTYGMGGDETFEWCETCGKIISEREIADGQKNKR